MSDARFKSNIPSGIEWRYVPTPGHWDEALDPSGHPRRHWRRFAATLRRMGYPEFSKRAETGERLIQANGITYNVYGDPQGKERPWLMDLVPLALDAGEWVGIERAVVQRATLLNALLADLYGPQRLLVDGRLPPELVFGNPNFLRACHGITANRGVYLQNYAADLARAPNGQWWVIADRTQAPSGMGYALENRLVTSRTLPTMLDQCHVRSLAPFFTRTLEALLSLAPARPSSPRIVVLTSGPHNETYFEHSYLSKHWGFPLVGGDDLTVRDSRVFLKTLAGLNPVDVILRRMDDDFCDPLELRGDSLLGIPGLVQAARAGTVFIANSLGSGLVEAPALMAFLPGLCRHLLGDDLLMPSVATWWCGQEGPRRLVLEHLEDLVIKPAFPRFGHQVQFPVSMKPAARRELARCIEARPGQFVAQEQVDLSTSPIHTHRGLEPRHLVLRVLAAWDGVSYAVLPGGLTRVATGRQSLVVSMQLGGKSKDTWVQSRRHEKRSEPRLAPPDGREFETTTELSSRVADNLFWLGRYAERLEAGARLTRVLLPGLSGESERGRSTSIDTVVHFLRHLNLLPNEFRQTPLAQQWWRLQGLLGDMVFDPEHPSGLGWNLKQIRRLGWEVKERLSQDTWRVLQQLDHDFSSAPPTNPDRRVVAALNQLDGIVIMMAAFAGLLAEHPARGHGWRFLDAGRRVERALQMLGLLRVGVALAPFPDDACLEVLLNVADSSTTYRSRYLTSIRTRFVLELLLTDEVNPRSVAFQLVTLLDRVDTLPQRDTGGTPPLDSTLASTLLGRLRAADIDTLKRRGTDGRRMALEVQLQALTEGVVGLSDALTARYLAHSTPSPLTPSF